MKFRLVIPILLAVTTLGAVRIAEVPLPQSNPLLDWYAQVVEQSDQDIQFTTDSLRIDHNGHPHIAYTIQGDLYHAWYDGTVWHFETVDGVGNPGYSPILALDSTDKPHIIYTNNAGLYYARWTGSTWTIQIVNGLPVDSASFVLDATDRPHISYAINNATQPAGYLYAVQYVVWTGSGWNIQTVEQGAIDHINRTVAGTSLALDSSGYPHISYALNDLSGPCAYCVRYASWTGSAWDIQTVEQIKLPFTFTDFNVYDLILDTSGQPHILYLYTVGSVLFVPSLRYARETGHTWAPQTVAVGFLGGAASLALDTDDHPHIGWDQGLNEIQHIYSTGDVWRTDLIAVGNFAGVSLVLDAHDHAHVVYGKPIFGAFQTLYYAQQLPALVLTKAASPTDGLTTGDTLMYTISFAAPAGHALQLSDPLPENLAYVPDSLTAPAVYSPTLRAIVWQGTPLTDIRETISFQVTLTDTGVLSPTSAVVVNTVWLTDTTYGKQISATAIVNGWHSYLPSVLR